MNVGGSNPVVDLFDLVAPGYDNHTLRLFPFCADRLVDEARLRSGERVLDIATGTGAVAVAAAARVAPTGRVIAIDLSQGMLEQAQAKVGRLGIDNIDVHCMDASNLGFRSDYFDVVLCSFGVFFIEDMVRAVTGWKRVLRPGGRLLYTAFGPDAFQPVSDLFFQALGEFDVELPADGDTANWQRLQDPGACRALFEDAGLVDCEVTTAQLGYQLGKVDDWWEMVYNAGYRGLIEQVAPDRLAGFRQSFLGRVQSLPERQRLWFDVQTHIASARAPG